MRIYTQEGRIVAEAHGSTASASLSEPATDVWGNRTGRTWQEEFDSGNLEIATVELSEQLGGGEFYALVAKANKPLMEPRGTGGYYIGSELVFVPGDLEAGDKYGLPPVGSSWRPFNK